MEPREQRTEERDGVAAPPDDGGHEGAFSRPQGSLDVADDGADTARPALSVDANPRPPMRHGARWVITSVILALALVTLWQYCGAGTGSQALAPPVGEDVTLVTDAQAPATIHLRH